MLSANFKPKRTAAAVRHRAVYLALSGLLFGTSLYIMRIYDQVCVVASIGLFGVTDALA